jgi:hypothetical protein
MAIISPNTRGGEEKVQALGEYALREALEPYSIYLQRHNYVSWGRQVPHYVIRAGIPRARVGGGPLPDAYGPAIAIANNLEEVARYLEGCERAALVPQEDVIDLTSGEARK